MRRAVEVGLNDKPLLEGKITIAFEAETRSDFELIEMYKMIHQYMKSDQFSDNRDKLIDRLKRNYIPVESHRLNL